MELTGLDRFFWVAGLAGHLVLLAALVTKKMPLRFPIFSVFIAFAVLRTIALSYLFRLGVTIYFYSYWSLALVDTLLQLLVLVEVAKKVFRPLGVFSPDIKKPLMLIGPFSICVAGLITFLALPPVQYSEQSIVIRGELFSTVMMSQLFVGLLVLSVTSGFTWNTHVGVIARGLGVFSLLSLVLQGLKGFYGAPHAQHIFKSLSQIQMCLYLCCLTYWIVGLTRRVPDTRPLPSQVNLKIAQLNRYVASVLAELRLKRGSL